MFPLRYAAGERQMSGRRLSPGLRVLHRERILPKYDCGVVLPVGNKRRAELLRLLPKEKIVEQNQINGFDKMFFM